MTKLYETKEPVYGPQSDEIPSVEFDAGKLGKVKDDRDSIIVKSVRRITLNDEECGVNRIATLKRDIQYLDFTSGEPVLMIMGVEITPLQIAEKKSLLKRCTSYDRAGVPEIDFDKMEDLMMARMLGLSDEGWKTFKTTHPIGLYTKLSIMIRDINGETAFTEDQIAELKNLEGRDQ